MGNHPLKQLPGHLLRLRLRLRRYAYQLGFLALLWEATSGNHEARTMLVDWGVFRVIVIR